MSEEKYQITAKANFTNLLLLEDEIKHYDEVLSEPLDSPDCWLKKIRATRLIFLTLYNIKEATNRVQLKGSDDYTQRTRNLRGKLEFANHVRNKGIGHLDSTLLKRAVQWNHRMFMDNSYRDEAMRVADAHRAVIESCINSYLDKNGVQKVFGHEIDLWYPKDALKFYAYLKQLVLESLEWLQLAKSMLHDVIELHPKEQLAELAFVAGATNFNLKEESDLTYSESLEIKALSEAMNKLIEAGFEQDVIDMIYNRARNITNASSRS